MSQLSSIEPQIKVKKTHVKKTIFIALSLVGLIMGYGILFADDAASTWARKNTQHTLNSYIKTLSLKTANQQINLPEKSLLHFSTTIGAVVSSFIYPEASRVLLHYIYGSGENLKLDASYFKQSPYIQYQLDTLGIGVHGPIALEQKEDYRLSLTFNPYYIYISKKVIRIYHPNVSVVHANNNAVYTMVNIGKLSLKVYDNLLVNLNPQPFYCYTEWTR